MILLAPLQGYTDSIFRNVYGRHFTSVDVAMSPYISLINGIKGYTRLAKDVLPSNNLSMPVIPQLMGNNPEYFIEMARVLYDWGYTQLNWNMGCPIRSTVRKKKGAGLLPYPEMVRDILEKTLPHIQAKLSIKIRLGYDSTEDIFRMIPVLNDFSLEYIIIHPRTGKQMYEGLIHHDVLQECLPLSKHEVVYNGDITNLHEFNVIKMRYPTVHKWMIGRGVFHDPFLPARIKGAAPLPANIASQTILAFLLELYSVFQENRTEEHLMSKIKNLWKLFCNAFAEPDKVFGHIAHASSSSVMIDLTKRILEVESLRNL